MAWLTEHATPHGLDGMVFALLLAVATLPLTSYRGRAGPAMARVPAEETSAAGRGAFHALGGGAFSRWRWPSAGRAHRHAGTHPGKRPNVLILAVDSLRADRVFSPDAARRFPALASLADRGVRFREAHVTVPRTFPSFVTLLTGRYPHHHGIRHMFPSATQRAAIGPALPSALRTAGYRTAVISDYAGEIFSRTPLGLRRGRGALLRHEDHRRVRGLQVHPNVLPYATSALGRRLFPAVKAMPELSDPARLAHRAMGELDGAGDKPLFLTVFFSTAHFPYASPDPYYRRYGSPRMPGPIAIRSRRWRRRRRTRQDRAADSRALRRRGGGDGRGDRAHPDAPRRRRADQDTIVVLLADHGENLYDLPERGMGHGDHLRGSAADHVPWVWIDPRDQLPPHDVPGIVRDVDFAPTLAHLLGVAAPPRDGVDLGPLLRGERPTLGLDVFQETELWFTANGPGFDARRAAALSEDHRRDRPGGGRRRLLAAGVAGHGHRRQASRAAHRSLEAALSADASGRALEPVRSVA